MKAASILPSLPAVAMVASCGESFTPGELAGTYGLASVGGTSPPYLEVATTECDQSIVDGVLGGDLVFEGQARGSFFVDVALPSTVVGLDPFLDVRFDRRRCDGLCPLGQ